MATATARAHVAAGTARAYDVRSRSAIPAHFDAIVQRSKGILAVITCIAFLVM